MKYTKENLESILDLWIPIWRISYKSIPEAVKEIILQDWYYDNLSKEEHDVITKVFIDLYITNGYFNWEEE